MKAQKRQRAAAVAVLALVGGCGKRAEEHSRRAGAVAAWMVQTRGLASEQRAPWSCSLALQDVADGVVTSSSSRWRKSGAVWFAERQPTRFRVAVLQDAAVDVADASGRAQEAPAGGDGTKPAASRPGTSMAATVASPHSGSSPQATAQASTVASSAHEIASTPDSVELFPVVREAAALPDVDLWILLGDNATTVREWHALLDALMTPRSVVVVVPGARESVPAWREALASYPRREQVIDASRPTALQSEQVAWYFVGGVRTARHLRAPIDGCTYAPSEVGQWVRSLAALQTEPRWHLAFVAAPVRAPRGADAFYDLGSTGVPIGDVAMATALAGMDAVFFGGAATERAGGRHPGRRSGRMEGVAVASLDLGPRLAHTFAFRRGVTLVEVDGQDLRWEVIPVMVSSAPIGSR